MNSRLAAMAAGFAGVIESFSEGQGPGDALLLVLELLRHARAVLVEVLADAGELDLPAGVVEAEQFGLRLPAQRDAVQVEVALLRQVADRRLDRASLALHALDHPLQHAQVVAEARPQELAVVALAEPVDVEDLRQL